MLRFARSKPPWSAAGLSLITSDKWRSRHLDLKQERPGHLDEEVVRLGLCPGGGPETRRSEQ